MPAGRPPTYESVEKLQEDIDLYFSTNPPDKHTITGIAMFLGFESRQSFYDYELRPEFSYTIKSARLRIENSYEIDLKSGKSPAGSIFALKNFGWTDKSEIEMKSDLIVKFQD